MSTALPGKLLYAAVHAADATAARAAGRGLAVVVAGAAAAVVGPRPRTTDIVALAMAHDRVMQRLLTRCSSVLPFRCGVAAPPAEDVRRLFQDNSATLMRQLGRFQGRVEMGLKIKARGPGQTAADFEVGPVHELVPGVDDRRERLIERADGGLFEGVYLIARDRIEEFWAALDRLRVALPGQPIVGVGPFAPYSFCDIQIDPTGFARGSE